MAKVSFLIPVYNSQATLEASLRSLLWQTYQDWEAVLADDGSCEECRALLREWALKDSRLKPLFLDHRGITSTLAEGLRKCSCELVARMDSDDIAHPRRLERQLAYIEDPAHAKVAALGCGVRIFPQVGRTLGMERYERWLNGAREPWDLDREIFVESPLVHPSVLFRRGAVARVGGYVEGPWPEDYFLWLRLWLAGYDLAKIPEIGLFWRDAPQRLTRTDPRCGHDSLRALKVEMFLQAYFPEAWERYRTGGGVEGREHRLWLKDNSRFPASRKKLLIWGAGPNGKALAKSLQSWGIKPHAFVDIRQARHGQVICGMPVWGIDELPEFESAASYETEGRLIPPNPTLRRPAQPGEYFLMTAVGNPAARAEIRAHLNSCGWKETVDYRCTAGIAD